MRPTPTFLLAFARLAAAACCRSNLCLREIVAEHVSDRNGLEDCSSYLAVTVTPDALTVYETVSEVPIEHTTKVETPFVTVSETVTVSTETVLLTVRTLSTATTEISLSTAVQTVIAATETRTATEFRTKTNAVGLKVRQEEADPTIPPYAVSACQSFAKYKRACSCAGVTATTVTVVAASAEPTTITVTENSSAVSVLSTLISAAPVVTETVTVPVVDTITDTTTEVDLLTATIASTTTTTTVSLTSTISTTSTQTASVCLKGALVGAFKANATQSNSTPLNIYANLLNGLTGGITWNGASGSTAAAVQNKYIWALDEEGRLNVAYNVPPYTYKYYAYMSTASPGSNWPQVNTEASVRSQVNAGGAVTYITGCVDSVTGELTLNAAGRTQIMWCGQQLWMSSTLGTDINRGVCVQMFPKVGRV